jgi:cytochrome c-type biogenesis protein CcmH/NrfG
MSSITPRSRQLVSVAPEGTPEANYCRLKLAELIMTQQPWRAARLSRHVARATGSPQAWALLGLAQSVLGHHRAAARAYREALRGAPNDPWIAHNLGHLLDVAFGRPRDAIGLLHHAHRALPTEQEVASSFAHALLAAGLPARAADVLEQALGPGAKDWLERWQRELMARSPSRKPPSLSDPTP